MALRIGVKVCYKNRCVEVLALLNTGFETPIPMVSLPIDLAEKLGLEVGSPIEFEGPGLTRGTSYHGGEVNIVVRSGNEVREVKARALITPGEEEVVMSDKCVETLGIVINLKDKKWWFT
ncbi:MAG: hypothetical protein DRO18_00970 [Thermoprotei archaeon]|nr:MAG: hypothetical protein DRO18_00970 [Thermoprotei archaeon]